MRKDLKVGVRGSQWQAPWECGVSGMLPCDRAVMMAFVGEVPQKAVSHPRRGFGIEKRVKNMSNMLKLNNILAFSLIVLLCNLTVEECQLPVLKVLQVEVFITFMSEHLLFIFQIKFHFIFHFFYISNESF